MAASEQKLNKIFDQNVEITGTLEVGGTLTVNGTVADLSNYLTSFTETDPTVPSHVKSITTTNISNWNTAYGWGNHADAGYLTSYAETDTLATVTARGATTSAAVGFSSIGLQLSGHWYNGFYSGTTNYIHLYPNGHSGGASVTNIRAWNGTSYDQLVITGGNDGIVWRNHTLLHTGNIGSQSVNYANSAGSAGTANSAGSATKASFMQSFDTRNSASTPQTYDAAAGIHFDFKTNSTNGLSDGGSYNGVLYWRKYGSGGDWSGGGAKEIAYTDNGNLWHRYGTGTSWGSWRKIIDSVSISSQSVNYAAGADTVDGLHASSFLRTDTNSSSTGYIASSSYIQGDTLRATNANDALGISFRSTNEVISGEGWCTAQYAYNSNDGFLFLNRDTSDNPHPVFHIGGHNNADYAGYGAQDSIITLTRLDGTKTTGSTYAGRGLSNTGYYTNIIKTTTETIFKDAQSKHNFTGDVYAYALRGNGNVGGTGNASWHPSGIYSAGYNWIYGGINGGNASATNFSDVRARIFYDYDDTTYYVNPNSSGTSARFYGNIDIYARSAAWAEGLRIRVPTTNTWGGIRWTRDRANYDGNWALGYKGAGDTTDDLVFWANNGGTEADKARLSKNGDLYVMGAIYSGVYYDRDDGNYYVNPNSLSRLKNVTIDGGHSDTRVQLYYNNETSSNNDAQMLLWASEPGITYSGVGIGANVAFGGQYYGRYSTLGTYGLWMRMDPDNGNWYFENTTSAVNTGGASRSTKFQIDPSGNSFSFGSSRAPIFYDYNDTTYYTDPGSSTISARLNGDIYMTGGKIHVKRGTGLTTTAWEDDSTANGRAQLILDSHYSDLIIASRNANTNRHGSTLTFATQSTTDNSYAKWVIGQGQWQEGRDHLSFAYGENQTNPHSTLGTDNANYDFQIHNGGVTYSSGSSRAPIFYDSGNTSYYADPGGTSSLARIDNGAGGTARNGDYAIALGDGALHVRSTTDKFHKMWYYDGIAFGTNYGHGHFRFYAETNDQRNSGTGGYQLVFDIDTQNKISTAHGTLKSTGDIIAYSSDARLKENVKPIENALNKVKQINGVTYDWKDVIDKYDFKPRNRKNDVGVIAQEVEAVLPQVVTLAPFDTEMDDEKEIAISKSGENYKTVQYEKIVPLLIEAVKELSNKVEELENKLNGSTRTEA